MERRFTEGGLGLDTCPAGHFMVTQESMGGPDIEQLVDTIGLNSQPLPFKFEVRRLGLAIGSRMKVAVNSLRPPRIRAQIYR